mmetsp:Transcript_37681/g.111528  ORF Transcript_37681/g.111528 Transcript_37681/m.111528 type:complete len:205 (-) Transcript_37681:2342-2956(-)
MYSLSCSCRLPSTCGSSSRASLSSCMASRSVWSRMLVRTVRTWLAYVADSESNAAFDSTSIRTTEHVHTASELGRSVKKAISPTGCDSPRRSRPALWPPPSDRWPIEPAFIDPVSDAIDMRRLWSSPSPLLSVLPSLPPSVVALDPATELSRATRTTSTSPSMITNNSETTSPSAISCTSGIKRSVEHAESSASRNFGLQPRMT